MRQKALKNCNANIALIYVNELMKTQPQLHVQHVHLSW